MSHRYKPTIPRLAALLGVCLGLPLVAAERVAVLTNGNVLVGEVQQQADRVIVTSTGAEISIPAREVEVVATSVRAAYQTKSAAIPNSAIRARSQLIRWCLKHGLREEARRELDRLRRLDPEYPELKALEGQVNSFRQPARTVIPAKSPAHPDVQFAAEQMSRLSKETVAEFVNGIQPLLINRCGLAGCHGKASSSSYSLVSAGLSRIPRNVTHRNLGVTLRRIGHDPTEQTRLWMSARSAHGGSKASPLSAAEQTRFLAWIQRVKADLGTAENQSSVITAAAELAEDGAAVPFDPADFDDQRHQPSSEANADRDRTGR